MACFMSHKNVTNIFMCHLRSSQQLSWWLLQGITVVSARGYTVIDHKTVFFYAFMFTVYLVLPFQTYSLVCIWIFKWKVLQLTFFWVPASLVFMVIWLGSGGCWSDWEEQVYRWYTKATWISTCKNHGDGSSEEISLYWLLMPISLCCIIQ
jgi:hypothetical protein